MICTNSLGSVSHLYMKEWWACPQNPSSQTPVQSPPCRQAFERAAVSGLLGHPSLFSVHTSKSRIVKVQVSKQKWRLSGFPGGSVVRNPPANAGDMSAIPGPGRPYLPWSSKAHVPQLLILCAGAWEPQLLKPVHPRACAPQQERPGQWEAHWILRVAPAHCNLGKAHSATKTHWAKNK